MAVRTLSKVLPAISHDFTAPLSKSSSCLGGHAKLGAAIPCSARGPFRLALVAERIPEAQNRSGNDVFGGFQSNCFSAGNGAFCRSRRRADGDRCSPSDSCASGKLSLSMKYASSCVKPREGPHYSLQLRDTVASSPRPGVYRSTVREKPSRPSVPCRYSLLSDFSASSRFFPESSVPASKGSSAISRQKLRERTHPRYFHCTSCRPLVPAVCGNGVAGAQLGRRSFGTQRVVQKRRHQMRILHPAQTAYVPSEQRPPPIPHSLTATSTVKRLLNNNTIAAKEAAKRINWDAYISHQRGVRWHPQGAWRVQFSRRNHERNFFVRCECYFRVGTYGFQMAKDLAIRYRQRLEKEWEELQEQWTKLDIMEAQQRAKYKEKKEEHLLLGDGEEQEPHPGRRK